MSEKLSRPAQDVTAEQERNQREAKAKPNPSRACLQCRISDMYCSRVGNQVTSCARCKRIGELCLVLQDLPPGGGGLAFMAAGGDSRGLQPQDVERLALDKIEAYHESHGDRHHVVQCNRWVSKPGPTRTSAPVWGLEGGAGLVAAQTSNFVLPDWTRILYGDYDSDEGEKTPLGRAAGEGVDTLKEQTAADDEAVDEASTSQDVVISGKTAIADDVVDKRGEIVPADEDVPMYKLYLRPAGKR